MRHTHTHTHHDSATHSGQPRFSESTMDRLERDGRANPRPAARVKPGPATRSLRRSLGRRPLLRVILAGHRGRLDKRRAYFAERAAPAICKHVARENDLRPTPRHASPASARVMPLVEMKARGDWPVWLATRRMRRIARPLTRIRIRRTDRRGLNRTLDHHAHRD